MQTTPIDSHSTDQNQQMSQSLFNCLTECNLEHPALDVISTQNTHRTCCMQQIRNPIFANELILFDCCDIL